MARLLDKIIIVDVEATCWPGNAPVNEFTEIIEVGICELNLSTLKTERNTCILVKPERSHISSFCTKYTTLTTKMIESEGISFSDACNELKKEFTTKKRAWGSWGDYDRRMFERQCRFSRVNYPFCATHLNIKNLFALRYSLNREISMAAALDMLGLELEGQHHRGIDDSRNIAHILAKLLKDVQS